MSHCLFICGYNWFYITQYLGTIMSLQTNFLIYLRLLRLYTKIAGLCVWDYLRGFFFIFFMSIFLKQKLKWNNCWLVSLKFDWILHPWTRKIIEVREFSPTNIKHVSPCLSVNSTDWNWIQWYFMASEHLSNPFKTAMQSGG